MPVKKASVSARICHDCAELSSVGAEVAFVQSTDSTEEAAVQIKSSQWALVDTNKYAVISVPAASIDKLIAALRSCADHAETVKAVVHTARGELDDGNDQR